MDSPLSLKELKKINPTIPTKLIYNSDYKETGNAYSMFLGLQNLESDIIIMDADLYYQSNIFINFIESDTKNSFLCGDALLSDWECSKIFTNKSNYITSIADKRLATIEEINEFNFVGEAIGIIKLSKNIALELYKELDKLLQDKTFIKNNWESVFNQFLINHSITTEKTISHHWIEIDTEEDYKRALSLV